MSRWGPPPAAKPEPERRSHQRQRQRQRLYAPAPERRHLITAGDMLHRGEHNPAFIQSVSVKRVIEAAREREKWPWWKKAVDRVQNVFNLLGVRIW